ncbi:non-oxidative hydroxyarylic acid decarboxylases subunit D [Pseudonocardia sp.]|uniref:non-oxidative hydroxyarylic acid decarboxylases subunit D n=1 Tax=Pseudonocardia sp. TaxID=60912 RepID=UPI0031FDC098
MSESEVCPRCGSADLSILARSAVADAWTVHGCSRCAYSWRSTEPPRTSRRDVYPDRFKLSGTEIAAAPDVPPVPEAARRSSIR